jgi:outer membrane protein assembly factor BamB
MVFAPSDLGTYYGLNAVSGDIEWAFKNPAATEFIVSSPIYVNGELFVVDTFNITCLNATHGHTNWSSFMETNCMFRPLMLTAKSTW